MPVKSISLKRFNILAAYIRQPSAYVLSEELEHLATDGDRVLGVLIRDRVDDDYAGLVLGKDESGQYRCVDILTFTNLYDSAREANQLSLPCRTFTFHIPCPSRLAP
jgi:hypothetical protein